MFLQDTCRYKGKNILFNLHILQIHHIIMKLVAQRPGYVLLCGETLIHQGFPQLTAASFLQFQSLLQLFCRYDAIVDKYVSQTQFFPVIVHLCLPHCTLIYIYFTLYLYKVQGLIFFCLIPDIWQNNCRPPVLPALLHKAAITDAAIRERADACDRLPCIVAVIPLPAADSYP